MNKSLLKKFATEARKEIKEAVQLQASLYGITKESVLNKEIDRDAYIVNDITLTNTERAQRNYLIDRIENLSETNIDGFDAVIEEVSYTWFNRFIAIRFMEVNGYLPSRIRVLSSIDGDELPDIIKRAGDLNFEELDKEKIYKLKSTLTTEEFYKFLFIAQCNELNKSLPLMFEKIGDYTELLFPTNIMSLKFFKDISNVDILEEKSWKNIEIIGWLYQFYIADKKKEVFYNLHVKKKKVTKEDIPAATQIFTPNWIVKYMIQNSLGRLYLEENENYKFKNKLEYYIDDAIQDNEINEVKFRKETFNPENIKLIDAAMGSGHILIETFDILYEIYKNCGYPLSSIPRKILENNIYGLELDERAAQLSYFALMMKARSYSRNIFNKSIKINLTSIIQSNELTDQSINFFCNNNKELYEAMKYIKYIFQDAKEYGSIIRVKKYNYKLLEERLKEINYDKDDSLDIKLIKDNILTYMPPLLKQAQIMSLKYDVFITNPPYLSDSNMNLKLKKYLAQNYKDSKGDMFAVFMETGDFYLKPNGFLSMINQHSWMFLSSYENLRIKILNNKVIYNMLHLGTRVFEELAGEKVQSTAFIYRNLSCINYKSRYIRLIDFETSDLKKIKTKELKNSQSADYVYEIKNSQFKDIQGYPMSYWATENIRKIFRNCKPLNFIADAKQGLATADNNRFLRLWYEVSKNNISFDSDSINSALKSGKKWFPYNKGGHCRKWYGNNTYIVNWENDGYEIKNFKNSKGKLKSRPQNIKFYFKEGITWSLLSSVQFSSRYSPQGFIFDVNGMTLFPQKKDLYYLLGFMGTNLCYELLNIINPTLAFQSGDVSRLPIIIDYSYLDIVNNIVKKNIQISKSNWDSYETSWNFKSNLFIKFKKNNIEQSFNNMKNFNSNQTYILNENEKKLNHIFIKIYNLEDKDFLHKNNYYFENFQLDCKKEIKHFISYFIGCLLGRFSLDEEGVVFDSGSFNITKYKKFIPYKYNVIPILQNEYLNNDIIHKFEEFLVCIWGKESLNENLDFIAEALDKKDTETSRECIRRYMLDIKNGFFKDHCDTYQVTGSGKRPIYWMFTSGKEQAFNCLIYMHRYDKTLLGRIRTDYVHPLQLRLDAEKVELERMLTLDISKRDERKYKKELTKLDKQIKELTTYEQKLRTMADKQIEIDLDDGFKVNYAKFEGLVAKVK